MDISRLLFSLGFGLVLLIFMIMRTKIHAALALILAAAFVGVAGGVPISSISGIIATGFGNTLGSIGLVIGFGVMMGQIMEESNAAKVMARTFIRALRGKHEEIALAFTGFLVSIPIFADSGFVILSPLLRAISKTTKKSLAMLGIAMGMSLAITHATVPPTPGPLGVVGIFRIDVGSFILFSIAMGLPIMVVAILCGRFFGNRYYKLIGDDGEIYDVTQEEGRRLAVASAMETIVREDPNEVYPSALISFSPIVLPVLLILFNTVLAAVYADVKELPLIVQIIQLIGSPVIAVGIGLLVAIYGLTGSKSKDKTIETMETGIKSAGLIILITGAGGAFGQILRSSGVGDEIAKILVEANFPVIILPFIIAGILKLALGSGTVAMITASSIMFPILSEMPGVNLMFAAYSACIGSQLCSIYNDSYFWVVTRTLGLKKVDEQILGWNGTEFICSIFGLVLLLIVNAIF
jgi:GntP family gluconate:H+ symporter